MASKRERSAPVIHDDGFMINGCMFHVDPKYKPIDAIGQGSYGVVCSVRNTESNEKLAIKKITPMAGDEWDATHTLREIRLMRCLGAHENIISLKDLSMREDKDELYMMMELADTDLHRLIQSSCPLTEGHIRVIMFQILSGVKAMHDNGVLHRDLKPGNLLLNKDCELKITDFGLARMIPRDQQTHDINAAAVTSSSSVVSPMTEYVVTRWYRPPELMLAPNGCYDGAVDMWSVGCILGELVSRKPMFPGTDFMDQLTRVFKVVAIPDKDHRGYVVEKDALKFLQSLPATQDNAVERHFKNAPPLALDLMKKLLCFNPKERLSAEQALAHPFFEGVKDEWGDITELQLGHSLEFAFEQQSLPLSTLRQYICDEVRAFRERDERATKMQTQKSDGNPASVASTTTAATKDAEASSKSSSSSNQSHSSSSISEAAAAAALRVVNDMPAGCGFTLKGCDFNVPTQYKPLQVLGEGSYGIVCAATDTTTKINVAIKKITPMAGDEWDAKHTLREIRLMRYFGHHPNIASLQNLSTCTEKDELYLMMDLVDTDLHRLIQSKTKLEEAHTAAIMYQLLCGAKVLHENGVLHRDLKPGNILVSKNCDVKITDFGLSRYIPQAGRSTSTSTSGPAVKHASHEKGKDLMTEYVVTRWYRAPEIMLAPNGTYGEAVDMWSIGCIFGELLNRKPMFPGSDFIDQLSRVFSVLPVPAADKRGYHVEGDAQKFLESLPACSPDAITKLFRKASAESVSLLRRLLCVNPERRITAKQALAHPYFKSIRAQLGEPPEFQVARAFDFEFDYQEFPLANLRQLIQDEVKLLQHDKAPATIHGTGVAAAPPAAADKNDPPVAVAGAAGPTGPHENELAKAHHNQPKQHHDAGPVLAATHRHHSHTQQDESDNSEEEDDQSETMDSVVSEATPSILAGPSEFLASKAKHDTASTTAGTKSSGQKPETLEQSQPTTKPVAKSPADPQDDNDDEDDQVPEEIIQVERTRRPVSGKLERPRSATATAASAVAARRAATAAATTQRDHRDEDIHHSYHSTTTSRQPTSSRSSTSTGNNDATTERWGHPRPVATTSSSATRGISTTTSSGATAILRKTTTSSAATSRLLSSSRTSSAASNQASSSRSSSSSSSSLHHSAKDNDDKSDAYRHPERAATSSSSRVAAVSSTRLSASTSAKDILPDGWVKKIHSKSGREYYYDTQNKVSSWKHPCKMDNIFGNNSHSASTAAESSSLTTTSTSRVASHTSRRTVASSSTYGTGKDPTISTSSSSSLGSGPSSKENGGSSTLPKDWERRTDPKTGRLFYVNLVTKKAFARLPSSVSASILTTGGRDPTIKKSSSSTSSSAAATIDAALKKKTTTVPQSPAFSQMSWQKKTPTARSSAATGGD